ncbi:MAG: septum site-determining protein MinD [Clostridia bacterium]
MGRIMVVTSGKGGVGKSTVTASLGASFAKAGRRTLLIDMDMGLRSLDVMLGLEDKVVYDLADVADGMCRIKQALLQHGTMENLFLLAAAQQRGSDALSTRDCEKVLDMLRDRFDEILIDCPAGAGRGFRNAVTGADGAILVETPDVIALRDAQRMVGLIRRMDIARPQLILNRVLPRHIAKDAPLDPRLYAERLGIPLLGIVPEDEDVPLSCAKGEPAALGASPSGKALERVARRLMGEDVPLVPVTRPGLFARLRRALRSS